MEGEAAARAGAILLDALALQHEHPDFLALAREGLRGVRLCQGSLTNLRLAILGEDHHNRMYAEPGLSLARLEVRPPFYEPDAEIGKAILDCISRGRGACAEGIHPVVRNMAGLGAWGVCRLQSQLRQLRYTYNAAQIRELVYMHAPVWPANTLVGVQRGRALRAAGAEDVLVRARLAQAEFEAVGAHLFEELRQQSEERRQAQQNQEDQKDQDQQTPLNGHAPVQNGHAPVQNGHTTDQNGNGHAHLAEE
ncbi:hypothetical protein GE09DRAFT_1152259 [Coniochaeta sp. 2T2.1]|nr:hypothetical protein GE09DRAFT_1152259 [Coniochaeta sp. 2T2.1]